MTRMRPQQNRAQTRASKVPTKNANEGPPRDVNKIDKTIMDNFYKLVHTQPNVRLTAACSTFKILVGLRKRSPASFNQHLNYCIDRLVKGLASSRAMARKGYATLLLEILRKNQVSTERLFSIGQQEFGNISNETSKDNLLGYYLLMNVILESENYAKTKQNSTYVEKIYKILRQLIDQKSYFDYPISRMLCQRYKIFYEYMLADIPPAAFGSDSRLTHTELLMIALCNRHKQIDQLTSLDFKDILHMSEALTGERLKRRPLHPVWVEWSQTVITHFPSSCEEYITNIVHSNFFKPNHNDLAAMGLDLIAKLIPNIAPMHLKLVLNKYVVRLLIVSLRSKNSLYKPSVDFFKTLGEGFKNNHDSYMNQQELAICLTSGAGSITFDQDSKSQTLLTLLNSFAGFSLRNLVNYLIGSYDKKKFPDTKRAYPVIGKLLAHIISRPQFRSPTIDRPEDIPFLTKWLIVHSLFAYVDPLAKDKEFWKRHTKYMPIKATLDIEAKNSLKSAYHAIMDYCVTSSDAEQRIVSLGACIDFCNQLIHHGAVGFYEHTGDITKTWQVYMVGLIEYRKVCTANGDPKILYPISGLYLLYGLQIVEHGLDCREQLGDLYQAAQDALKNDPSDGSWADILTDQIISILSATECNPWIRKLCVSIFGALLPHISETSIDLLCDVIRARPEVSCDGDEEGDSDEGSEGGEQDMSIDCDGKELADESEEVDGMDDVSADANAREADESNEESSGDEDEDMDFTDGSDSNDDDSQSDIDSPSKEVKESSGEADANDKEDSDMEDEEEYLNDEEMMKLDSVLVDMFKQNRVGSKKKRRDPSFKLRCLDLVKKVLAKKHNDSEVIKKILSALIPVAARSRKSADLRPIADKIDSMIAKMPGKSRLDIPGLMNGKRSSNHLKAQMRPHPQTRP